MIDYVLMGKRVHHFREAKGWTQAELAYEVCMSNATISHIECGSGKPELTTVVNIANALGVTVDMLLCDSLEHAEEPYHKELAALVKSCTVDELRLLCDIIEPLLHTMRKSCGREIFRKRGNDI